MQKHTSILGDDMSNYLGSRSTACWQKSPTLSRPLDGASSLEQSKVSEGSLKSKGHMYSLGVQGCGPRAGDWGGAGCLGGIYTV